MVEVKYIYSFQGKPINEYTIRNGRYQVSVLNLGATMTKFVVRNRFKKYESVHLRYHDYRSYREDPHLLTSVWINRDNQLIPLSSVLFECQFEENGLCFTSCHPSYPITIEYLLQNKKLTIQCHQMDDEAYHFAFYYNLTGNIKRDCSMHQCKVDETMVDLFNPMIDEYIQADKTLFLMDMENGVKLKYETPLSFIINNRLSVPEVYRFNKGQQITENDLVKVLVPLSSNGITIDFSSQ